MKEKEERKKIEKVLFLNTETKLQSEEIKQQAYKCNITLMGGYYWKTCMHVTLPFSTKFDLFKP
jgi:hypothetical protein